MSRVSKIIKNCVIIFLLILFLVLCWVYAFGFERTSGYSHPDYVTNYTVDEHIERIKARTREKYKTELESGVLVDFEVYILHAFYDDDPEYFLVEFEYRDFITEEYQNYDFDETKEESEDNQRYVTLSTKHMHTMGYILNDKYYNGLVSISTRFGKSSYTLYGHKGSKKYFGSRIEAVKIGNDIVQIGHEARLEPKNPSLTSGGVGMEFHVHDRGEACSYGRIIDPLDYEKYMKQNYVPILTKY